MIDKTRRALQVMDQGIETLGRLLEERPVDAERVRAVALAAAAAGEAHEQFASWERSRDRDRLFAAAITEVLDSGASITAARGRLTVLAADLRGGLDAPDEWRRLGASPFRMPGVADPPPHGFEGEQRL